MKFFQIKWTILSIGVVLLAACSSGGGGTPSNTMTITTTNALGAQTTFVADSSNSVLSAHTNTTENKTIVEICGDVDKDNDCSKLVIMTIDGTTAQKYTMDSIESPSQIIFQDDAAEKGIIQHYISSGGEIKVTNDQARSAVQGTFNTTLECNSGCTGTVNVAGTFNIDLAQ